jgi:hypothetical protein
MWERGRLARAAGTAAFPGAPLGSADSISHRRFLRPNAAEDRRDDHRVPRRPIPRGAGRRLTLPNGIASSKQSSICAIPLESSLPWLGLITSLTRHRFAPARPGGLAALTHRIAAPIQDIAAAFATAASMIINPISLTAILLATRLEERPREITVPNCGSRADRPRRFASPPRFPSRSCRRSEGRSLSQDSLRAERLTDWCRRS